MSSVSFSLNGKPVSAEVEARTLLVSLLRDQLRQTGTHVLSFYVIPVFKCMTSL